MNPNTTIHTLRVTFHCILMRSWDMGDMSFVLQKWLRVEGPALPLVTQSVAGMGFSPVS